MLLNNVLFKAIRVAVEKNLKTEEEAAKRAARLVSETKVNLGLLASLQNAGSFLLAGAKSVGGGIASFYTERHDFDEAVSLLDKVFEQMHADYSERLLQSRRRGDEDGRYFAEEVLDHLQDAYAISKARLEQLYGSKMRVETKREAYADLMARLKEVPANVKAQAEKEKREAGVLPV